MFNRKKMIPFWGANLLFALFILLSPLAYARPNWSEVAKQATDKKLDTSVEWLRLGHYPCASCVSEQDSSPFFLAADGRESAKSEFSATLQAFTTNPIRQHPQPLPTLSAHCQYPARLKWLSQHTGNWDYNSLLKTCTGYQEFRSRMAAKGVSLVFSSFYLNNPSSAFGHTLLKIERERVGGSADLLNYGVNYAANPTTQNPILYAVMGLFGGFEGVFSNMPYYYKVREYNDFDNRDLWEYELNLTPDEIDTLVMHLWELGFSSFRYFYLSENCSYQLLRLLDVASPHLNLTEPLPYWVLPLDTVKAVTQTPGLVKKINHRPSLAASLESRYFSLNKDEQTQFFTAIKDYSPNHQMSVATLDTVIDKFDIEYGQKLLQKEAGATNKKHQLLLKRATYEGAVPEFTKLPALRPDESHGSLRLELAPGKRSTLENVNADTLHFGIRFALRDLIDPIHGLPPYARLEMFYGDLFYDFEKDRLRVDRFRFVGIEALNNWNPLWAKPAWRFDLGSERIQDSRCFDCMTSLIGGSIGLSKSIYGFSPFVYLNARARGGKFVNDDFSTEAGPSLRFRFVTAADFNLLAEYERRTVWNTFEDHLDIAHFSIQKSFDRKWGLRLHHQATRLKADEWHQTRFGIILFN